MGKLVEKLVVILLLLGRQGGRNSTFGSKKAILGIWCQTGTYCKTVGIQSYLMTWGSYDPIESGPREAK